MTPVDVTFRVYPNGDVIALFPGITANFSESCCLFYSHIGQHGAADYTLVMSQTRKSNAEEAAYLIKELKGLGYKLRFVKRETDLMRKTRRQQISDFLCIPDECAA